MNTLTTAEARADFADVINRVGYGKERIAIARRGSKVIAFIVPPEDVAALEAIEEDFDVRAVRKAIEDYKSGKDPGRSAEEVFAEILKEK